MELHFKYLGAVQVADKKIEGEKHVCIPAYLLTTVGSPPFAPLVYLLSIYRIAKAMCLLPCGKGKVDYILSICVKPTPLPHLPINGVTLFRRMDVWAEAGLC